MDSGSGILVTKKSVGEYLRNIPGTRKDMRKDLVSLSQQGLAGR